MKSKLKAVPGLIEFVRGIRAWKKALENSFSTRRTRNALHRFLSTPGEKGLQLGAGNNPLRGWFNTDLFESPTTHYLNLLKPIPFPDDIFDYICAEHLFEHLSHADGQALLKECFRILKRNGILRMSTPDLEKLVSLFRESRTAAQNEYIRTYCTMFLGDNWKATPAFVLNSEFRDFGHQFLYDKNTLRKALEDSGFTNICFQEVGKSRIPTLVGVESREKNDLAFLNVYESMIVEATRPATT